MPDPDPPPEQHRRALLLLADEVAGWHAELGAPRAEAALAAGLELLGHALVDLADGRQPHPRQAATHRPGGRGGTRGAGGSPGPDRAACSAL
ncbi:hypothetical protein, partial [Ornithinicoccus halotolerans]|uniref:hypothetical protein n=1 Tax=Ornithinicoccus halotolerans TaxID=1748220 RepID=UPI001294FB67